MAIPELAERVYASLPSADERFTDMRAFLARHMHAGSKSPTARILGEWALLGYLFQSGKIGAGKGIESVELRLPTHVVSPEQEARLKEEVDAVFQAEGWNFE